MIKISIIFAVLIPSCSLCHAVNVTNKDFGTLIGSVTKSAWTSRKIYQFLGVRYAESPSGDNRFKEPEIAVPWPGVHDVREYGRPCPTIRDLRNMTPSELEEDLEDCLHLSIYSTNLNGSNPVMVYIHGGSFTEGSSANHPPNYLLEKDIVLVVPQYRLGPLGFLCTLTADIPGNAGVLDIVLALSWIKSYIKYFGGDPFRITVAGQSAGATILTALLFNPNIPSGFFQQAIIQSGSYLGQSSLDLDPVATAFGIADYSDCYNIDTIEEINRCFMEMDVLPLLETYNKYSKPHDHRKRISLALNNFLPLTPSEIIKGVIPIKNVTIMAGVTKHDGGFMLAKFYDFLLSTVGLNNTSFNSLHLMDSILNYSGMKDHTDTLSGYLTERLFNIDDLIDGNFSKMLPGLMDLSNVVIMKGPVYKTAQILTKYFGKDMFLYSFEYRGEFSYLKAFNSTKYPYYNGIQHCDDLIYLFPYPDYATNLNANDRQMAQKMIDLWTSFVITGKPKTYGIPHWPSMKSILGPYLHINKKSTVGTNFLKEFTVISRESGLPDICDSKSKYYYYSVS